MQNLTVVVKTRLALKELQLQVGYLTLVWWWVAFYFVLPDPYSCKYCHKWACLNFLSLVLFGLWGGGVKYWAPVTMNQFLFWFWILFTERDLSWKCSIKISHLLMWVSTITRWPWCWECKARLIWRRGSSQGRFSVQFLGFFLPQTPPGRSSGVSLGSCWAVPLLPWLLLQKSSPGPGFPKLCLFHTTAGQPKVHPSPAMLSVLRNSTVNNTQLLFQMHSTAGYVTGSFRIPLIGNIKSKSVC